MAGYSIHCCVDPPQTIMYAEYCSLISHSLLHARTRAPTYSRTLAALFRRSCSVFIVWQSKLNSGAFLVSPRLRLVKPMPFLLGRDGWEGSNNLLVGWQPSLPALCSRRKYLIWFSELVQSFISLLLTELNALGARLRIRQSLASSLTNARISLRQNIRSHMKKERKGWNQLMLGLQINQTEPYRSVMATSGIEVVTKWNTNLLLIRIYNASYIIVHPPFIPRRQC